jgi:4a-hydroxytetrahydrobiopterin dehydratase
MARATLTEAPRHARAQRDGSRAADRTATGRTSTFSDCNAAFGCMTHAALLAEKMNQHPRWFNVYDRLGVASSRDGAGRHRALDARMVKAMDRFGKA